jgi:hypothetical protein
MEIVLALIIGLAVTGVVFVLGRTFAVSGRAGQVQHQPELLISASVSPDAASDVAKSIVHEAERERTAEPVPPHRDVQKKVQRSLENNLLVARKKMLQKHLHADVARQINQLRRR